MEAKHTKGPWILRNKDIIGYPESNIAIARLLDGVGQPAEANGKLMTAAPDLISELQYIAERIDTVILNSKKRQEEDPFIIGFCQALKGRAVKAIKKATE